MTLPEHTSVRTVMASKRPPPVHLRIEPPMPQWRERVQSFRARKSVEHIEFFDLKNHTLFPHMIAVAEDGRIARHTVRRPKLLDIIPSLTNSTLQDRFAAFQRGVVDAISSTNVPVVEEPCLLLGSGQGFNYYHWLVEFIPKLDLLHEDLASGRRLVIPRMRFSFHSESLLYFGIDPRDCISVTRPTRFRDLRTTSCIVGSNQKLSSFVGAFYDRRAGSGGRKLYVTRKDARWRRVLNEDDVMTALSGFGFEMVCPGQLSFAEQASLFRDASIVVGPHGAGLANIVFMPSGGKVIELIPDSFTGGVTCYAALSEERKLDHTIVICGATGIGGKADMNVPVEVLTAAVG